MVDDLMAHFPEITDPRCAGKVEHRLMDVLVIAVCATIATNFLPDNRGINSIMTERI